MKRETLDASNLRSQAALYGVEFCDDKMAIESSSERKGCGLVAIEDIDEEDAVLIRVPSDLVLSLERVWVYGLSDRHLRELLEATGEFSRTAKGAIRLFLLLQLTHGATNGEVGVSSFFSTYVKYLPKKFGLPTLWDEDELKLLRGTSLEAATTDKLESLDREFSELRETTTQFEWCRKYWWYPGTGSLTFDDWKVVDAMYRSRAMDLPGTGHATVPIMDMANHAVGSLADARYETDPQSDDAVLVARDSVQLKANDEITISYGDDNGAAEMLHSYGFIEPNMSSAGELWLDLAVPPDDPLGPAKKRAAQSPSGFKLFIKPEDPATDSLTSPPGTGQVCWEGPYVWLINVNMEDGLDFSLAQTNDGETDLQTFWKGEVLADVSNLEALLVKDPFYDVIKLRTITMLRERISEQLSHLEESKEDLPDILQNSAERLDNYHNAIKLRDLEEQLMLQAHEEFGSQQEELAQSPVVQEYLRSVQANDEEDDFT